MLMVLFGRWRCWYDSLYSYPTMAAPLKIDPVSAKPIYCITMCDGMAMAAGDSKSECEKKWLLEAMMRPTSVRMGSFGNDELLPCTAVAFDTPHEDPYGPKIHQEQGGAHNKVFASKTHSCYLPPPHSSQKDSISSQQAIGCDTLWTVYIAGEEQQLTFRNKPGVYLQLSCIVPGYCNHKIRPLAWNKDIPLVTVILAIVLIRSGSENQLEPTTYYILQ